MTRKPKANAPTVLNIVADRTGCSLWRVFQPTKLLESRGYRTWWAMNTHDKLGEVAVTSDVLVLPRLSWPASAHDVMRDWLYKLRAANKRLVYEVDDDLFTADFLRRQLSAGWITPETWPEADATRLERIWTLQQCDAVTVSTRPLADLIRGFTAAPVYVVPNAIDLPWFQGVLKTAKRQVPPLTVGWAGGQRDAADTEQLGIAWARLAARFPDLRFVTMGHQPRSLAGRVPTERLYHVPWQQLETYPTGYVNLDIGCAVVEDSPFNRSKSVIKIWEYSAAGVPCVASHALYGDWVRDGSDGLLATTADEWEHQLARLITDRFLRERLARRALRRIEREDCLEVQAHRWIDVWSEVWRRPAAALVA